MILIYLSLRMGNQDPGVGKMSHDRTVGPVVIFGKLTLMSMFPGKIIVLMRMFPSHKLMYSQTGAMSISKTRLLNS